MCSHFVQARHYLPEYAAAPDAWVAALRDLVRREQISLVFPTSDQTLIALARHADEIGRERLALPNPEAAAIFIDKGATRALAAELGVPVAAGGLGSDAGFVALARAGWGLPLVLKPRQSHVLGSPVGKAYARIVRTEAELAQALAATDDSFVLEKFFDGTGVGVSILARDGQVLQIYQHGRLRQAWETGPSSARISQSVDEELSAAVLKIAAAVSLTGVAMFEFRRKAPGDFVLLEVNARLWGSLPLAVEAGADFPVWLYDLLVHEREPAPAPYRIGLVRRDLSGEYRRIADKLTGAGGIRQRLAGLAAGAGLVVALLRPRSFDTWAGDDPGPFRQEVRKLAAGAALAIRKRLRLIGARATSPAVADHLSNRALPGPAAAPLGGRCDRAAPNQGRCAEAA